MLAFMKDGWVSRTPSSLDAGGDADRSAPAGRLAGGPVPLTTERFGAKAATLDALARGGAPTPPAWAQY